jgi:UDP-N-acetylglucosamine diphosphorylase / glucose-1-phosphate thymidylyltransferase / UDP-N-acetylgalactosamine diphosphorylase / glucosamine-1-phosphate N-acetyltransferase / galactosamine-1-phosphate N-acetyltransferase
VTVDAVVMAAGRGTRLRPVTDRWPKPVLPIDGRPVLVSLLRELEAAGLERVAVVTGNLAPQVERLLDGFPLDVRLVRQPEALGSADAVLRAEPRPPVLVAAADTLFARGDIARFLTAGEGAVGALAVRPLTKAGQHRVRVEAGRIVGLEDTDESNTVTAAPLWLIGEPVLELMRDLPGPPFELVEGFRRALAAGHDIRAVPIGTTRDLTDPLDLARENFSYLRGLE